MGGLNNDKIDDLHYWYSNNYIGDLTGACSSEGKCDHKLVNAQLIGGPNISNVPIDEVLSAVNVNHGLYYYMIKPTTNSTQMQYTTFDDNLYIGLHGM